MMFRWLAENYRTFLWAFALAIAVWISAVSSADPDETRQLRSAVPLQLVGQDPALVISSDLPKEVRITLHAPRSVWDAIEADPQSVRAVLDISGLSSGEHTATIQVQISARPVRVLAAAPSTVTFNLEALATKNIMVTPLLSGEVAIGYQVGELELEPRTVVVAGAESLVTQATQARVLLDIGGLREDFEQTLPVEILGEEGAQVTGISISPETIQVTLPVSQQGGYRDVAVKVLTSGRVASGYRITDISVSPPVVTIFSANPQLVQDLPGVVETQVLDLQNARDNISARVELQLPTDVSIVGEQAVLIQVGIAPIESSVTLAGEKVDFAGLAPALSAQISPATVDVIVSGPLPVLDLLTRQDVRVTVDLTGLGVGVHQIIPQVEALIADVTVQSVLPNTIEVVITPGVTPTP